ncbi:MAG: homoserine O-succinyltransferase [Gammaproteobacteria bacterium]|nr:homoserine O-succinyltransferase [Gammaproteobacteria bacterium]
MPLVAHSNLPSFDRLRCDGEIIMSPERARMQDIREIHIGLLNMMPDAALSATERQFFRLIGGSNHVVQFYVHPFSLKEIDRSSEGQAYIDQYYESFDDIKREGLDGLIITGANVTKPDLSAEAFWEPLSEIMSWAYDNVTSTLCSCLTTHAVMQFRYGQVRRRLSEKRWGVFPHRVIDRLHPLVTGVNTRFDVPHSRFNEITREQFEQSGLNVLVESEEAGVHLAVSEDGFRTVFFQGHPEYDTISLLKEYKREVKRYFVGDLDEYPPVPRHYFSKQVKAVADEFRAMVENAKRKKLQFPDFPEQFIEATLDNTWRDTAEAVINNWVGKIYQLTNQNRLLPFMEGVDPANPLGLERKK